MVAPRVSQDEFIRLFETHGPAETARIIGVDKRSVFSRRTRVERALGRQLYSPVSAGGVVLQERGPPKNAEIRLDIQDGIVLVGSDAHYWPGMISTAHAGFVRFIEEMKPAIVVHNGDVVDGAALSRWPAGSWSDWEYRPQFFEELEAAKARMGEIESAAKGAHLVWPAGNHDLRFEAKIANEIPELARVPGVHLKDHFPAWRACWDLLVHETAITHVPLKQGLHSGFNSTIWDGYSFVAGHLHKGIVYPFTDRRGTRYGVDCPTLAEPYGRQFVHYSRNTTKNWRSGFVVLTFIDGTLCFPELALVYDVGVLEFRGRRIKV